MKKSSRPGQKKETQRAGEMLPTMKLPGAQSTKRGTTKHRKYHWKTTLKHKINIVNYIKTKKIIN